MVVQVETGANKGSKGKVQNRGSSKANGSFANHHSSSYRRQQQYKCVLIRQADAEDVRADDAQKLRGGLQEAQEDERNDGGGQAVQRENLSVERKMPAGFTKGVEKAAEHSGWEGGRQARAGAGNDGSSCGCDKCIEKVHTPCNAEYGNKKSSDLVSDAEQGVACAVVGTK
jgi:hypothetical protein